MLQVMVEESPGIKCPGVTEVMSMIMRSSTLRVGSSEARPAGALAAELEGPLPFSLDHGAPGGMLVTLSVKHITINDLQGCVEHRHILSGAAEEVRGDGQNLHFD